MEVARFRQRSFDLLGACVGRLEKTAACFRFVWNMLESIRQYVSGERKQFRLGCNMF